MKYRTFPYKLTMFLALVTKNLVQATLKDVVHNTCLLHENVKRSIKALNWFFKKNKAKDLIIPTSTIDASLKMICSLHLNNVKVNRNPFNWDPHRTKGRCQNYVGNVCFDGLKYSIALKELDKTIISYSQWISEKNDKKSKQILRQEVFHCHFRIGW